MNVGRIITEDNVDTLTSMSFSDNIIKLTDGDVKFEPAKDKDYLSEYVERYKRIVDQLVTKLSSAPDKEYLPTPFDISELAQEQESEPVKETDSESYHPAPTESDKSTEEIKDSDSSIQYKFVGDSDESFENNTPPVDWNPEGQGPFMPKTPPMPLDSSGDYTIPSPPQDDYFGDEKLTKIYDNMSSASRLQLNKLSREEQIDVLKKVYNKRSGEGNIDEEESEEKTEILETDDKKETADGEEDDGSNENNNDSGNQGSSGGTKQVSFS